MRIPDLLFKSVVYLFPTREAAETGSNAGGTGFLVSATNGKCLIITNIHVSNAGSKIARVNSTTGSPIIIDLSASAWINHPDADDVSCAEFPTRIPDADVVFMTWDQCVATPDRWSQLNIGVGDDIFMIGRFVSREGILRNAPLVRFGNIAMMPGDPVRDGRKLDVEAFLLEMRSASGFSGSPVFVAIPSGSNRGNGTMNPFFSDQLLLIGIDTGHIMSTAPVFDEDDTKAKQFVKLNAGISIVSPFWKIAQILSL